MHKRFSSATRRVVVLVALAMMLAVAAPAAAVPLSIIDVTLLLRPAGLDEPLLLISGTIPEGQELPAEVILPLPAGAEIIWAGEVFGGDIANDIQVEPVITRGETHDVATVTLTQARTAQIEVMYPEGRTVDDIGSIAAFEFPSTTDAAQARLAIAAPTTLQARQALVDLQAAATPDATYYYKELTEVSEGDPLALRLELQAAAPMPQTTPAPGGIPPIVLALAAAVLAIGAIAVVAARQQRQVVGADTDSVAIEEYDGSFEDVEEYGYDVSDDGSIDSGSHESADDDEAAVEEFVEIDEDAAAGSAPRPGRSNRMLVTVAVVLVLGLIVGVFAFGGGEPVGVMSIEDGLISQRISTAEGTEQAAWEVAWPCACPPEAEAPKIFGALSRVPGVARAQLRSADLFLQVEYDPAQTDPESIATALRQAGYLN